MTSNHARNRDNVEALSSHLKLDLALPIDLEVPIPDALQLLP